MTVPTGQLSNQISNWLLDKILASRDPIAEIDPSTGRHVLSYGKAYRWMVISLLAIAVSFLALGIWGSLGDPKALLIVGGVFGVFTLAMVISFYEMVHVRLAFSRDGLYKSSPLGRELFIPWSGLDKASWSESFKWLKLSTGTGEVIRISIYRDGLRTLAETASERLEGTAAAGHARLIREKVSF